MIPFVHFPVVEILHFLMKMRHNRLFMLMSRIVMLTLVTISALSYLGIWAEPQTPDMPGCTLGRWPCYLGPALTFSGLVYQLGASPLAFLLPLLDLSAALILFFRPPRTYLPLLVAGFLGEIGSSLVQPRPYLYVLSGPGFFVHMVANLLIFLLAFPLALDEQMRLYPHLDYQKVLPWYVQD